MLLVSQVHSRAVQLLPTYLMFATSKIALLTIGWPRLRWSWTSRYKAYQMSSGTIFQNVIEFDSFCHGVPAANQSQQAGRICDRGAE